MLLMLFISIRVSAQDDDLTALEDRLLTTPILYNMDSPRLAEIFAAGQALGNRADVFTTIGDSNTTNGDFLQAIGLDDGDGGTWGEYDDLRTTVSY